MMLVHCAIVNDNLLIACGDDNAQCVLVVMVCSQQFVDDTA